MTRNLSIVLIVAGFTFAGCGKSTEPSATTPLPALPKPEQALGAYANELIKKNSSLASGFGPTVQTTASPLAYLTVFTSSAPVGSPAEGWQATYCNEDLLRIMAEYGILMATGKLLDSVGTTRGLALCIAPGKKLPPPSSDAQASGEGVFSAIQICKAALGVMYRRDVGRMKGTMVDGYAQVKYVRDSDHRELSYRCKLSEGLILTWDDNLVGARWYGSQDADSKLTYSVAGEQLLIQYVLQKQVDREQRFSVGEL